MSTAELESHLEDIDIPVARAYPSQKEAAKMLGISETVLSRAKDFPAESAGSRNKHYSPSVILQAAAHYRRRSLNEVAADIIAYTDERAPDWGPKVREQVDEFFADRDRMPIDRARFLEEARETLPPKVFAEVRRAYEREPRGESFALNFASEVTADAV